MELSDLKGKKIALLGMGLENIFLAGFLLAKGINDLEFRDRKDLLEIGESVSDEAKELFNTIIKESPSKVGSPFGRLQQGRDDKTKQGISPSGRNDNNQDGKILKQVQDDKVVGAKHLFGEDYLNDLNQFDIIFRTPGLPYLTPEIQAAKKAGVIISSQIKLFFDLCPAKIIGVTGTKGKGTTASLIEAIAKQNLQDTRNNNQTNLNNQITNNKAKVFLLGNIGQAAVNRLDEIKVGDIVILELSSFQLQDLEKSPQIAVITNLGEDHLNYHNDLDEYWGSKANILKYQSQDDFAVLNQDYLTTFELASQTKAKIYYFSGKNSVDSGSYIRQSKVQSPPVSPGASRGGESKVKEVILKINGKEEVVCRSDELKIVGDHNLENVAAAAIVGQILNVEIKDLRSAILDFKGLEHRLEFVAEKDGVNYFNDSFATNPIATLAAIRAFYQPLILILGGSEKNLDYDELIKEIRNSKNIKAVIYVGETGKRLAEQLKTSGYDKVIPGGQTIYEIVTKAQEIAESGDVVLLSPASASFGLFRDYKDRGNQFKSVVSTLGS